MKKKTKILVIAANPRDTSRLRLDEEVREIEQALHRSPQRNLFSVKSIWAPRSKDLRRALLDEQPQIVHFSGHGDPGGLLLEDLNGESVIVPPEALKDLFNLFSKNLHCVLLNACYSEFQAAALATRISYVIGMKEAIADNLAIEFAGGFYDALGAGRTVEEAFQFGCNAINLLAYSQCQQPILLSKSELSSSQTKHDSSQNIYRFRAEVQQDVDELRKLLAFKFDRISVSNKPPFPDVEVEIETNYTLEELRDLMRKVVDGHVMVETLAYSEEYTGERNYTL